MNDTITKRLRGDAEMIMNHTFDRMEQLEEALAQCVKVITWMRQGDRFYDDEKDAILIATDLLEE